MRAGEQPHVAEAWQTSWRATNRPASRGAAVLSAEL